MLDPKYALKYKMPHSLLHIVDNSMYTGQLTPTVADDPSLYATIVVSGSPIGVDNRFVNLTRSDIASISFGLGGITTDDIKRFGQSVEYPLSLIQNSNAPVRFMRVTPEGSTFAVYTLLVQWKEDGETLKVRFVEQPISAIPEIRLDRFKNPERLNAAIVSKTKSETADGWKQAVLMNIISAGRGKAYNDMAFTIDLGKQQKRALNVRYLFNTLSTTGVLVESFSASLVNNNTSTRATSTSSPIESVNVAVSRRMDGSSILVPFVNESAVGTVYKAYCNIVNPILDTLSENDQKMFKLTTVNTFDILFGKYIYDGAELDLNLPNYQVEMYNPDIAKLDEQHRVISWQTAGEPDPETTPGDDLNVKLRDDAYGISDDASKYPIHVGDLYLTSTSGYAYPSIALVTTINQYTGAVTAFQISRLFETANGEDDDSATAELITIVATDIPVTTTDEITDPTIKKLYKNGTIKTDTKYWFAEILEGDATTIKLILGELEYKNNGLYWKAAPTVVTDVADIRTYLPLPNGQTLVARVDDTTTVTQPVGSTLIDANGAVYVVDYDSTAYEIAAATIHYGTCPPYISVVDDKMGIDYDVMWYDDTNAGKIFVTGNTKKNTKLDIANGGSGYAKDDRLKLTLSGSDDDPAAYFTNVVFKVLEVDASGEITDIAVDTDGYEGDTYSKELGEKLEAAKTGTPFIAANALSYVGTGSGTGASITIQSDAYVVDMGDPTVIKRWTVTGSQGSLYRVQLNPIEINADYYTADYGVNPIAELGGLRMQYGSTGFFDDVEMDSIEFKYRYSALLVQAYKGQIDPKILSPVRCPAKYLFDGGTNTIISQTILPDTNYSPIDLINASTIFTEDEKDRIMLDPTIVTGSIEPPAMDIDVKQAMYDLMIERVYLRIPEDKRPIGPGYGLSLHLDSGVTDATTVALINTSFARRFTNPNASWDIGGYTSSENGITYTFTKNLADNLIAHCKANTVNKPYVMSYATIASDQFTSYFPDIDLTDWDMRDYLYSNGGNAWVPDINGNLVRRSQRTMQTYEETSDLVQESNMRTLSQLCYLLQNKIDGKLFEYDDDDVLKTISDEINNMFSNWRGNLVQDLEIRFERDTNPTDGGDIVVCYCNVTFRGLILRVPIIVNVQRRTTT